MRHKAASVAATVGWFGPAAAPVVPAVAHAFGLPLRLLGSDGVALTFDDGPHPQGTRAVLDLLERAGARATFFLVGEQVDRDAGLVRELVAAGHAVGIHGYRHTLLLRRSPRAVRGDVRRAVEVIESAAGIATTLYRPPYGVLSGPALLTVRRLGLRPLLWSRWGRDWEARATPRSIAARATRSLAAGDVILLHDSDRYSSADSWRRTAAALPSVLDVVAESGLPLVVPSQST